MSRYLRAPYSLTEHWLSRKMYMTQSKCSLQLQVMHLRMGQKTYQGAVWASHSSGEDKVAALAGLQEVFLRLKVCLHLRDCWEDSQWRRGWGQNARRRRRGERAWWRRRRRGPCNSHGLCPAHPQHHKTAGQAPSDLSQQSTSRDSISPVAMKAAWQCKQKGCFAGQA